METITLHFGPVHAKKLLSGRGVAQLGKEYISGSQGEPLQVQVSKSVANRIRKAQRAGKSTRVRLDELHGQGIKEFFAKLKRGFEKAGEVLKPIYEKIKPAVAPLLREGVTKLADIGASAAAPFLPAQVNKLIQEQKGAAVQKLGDVTGAYGVVGLPLYGGAMMPHMGVYYPQPYSNWSTQSLPLAPAMLYKLPFPGYGFAAGTPGGEPIEPTRGSGFRVL